MSTIAGVTTDQLIEGLAHADAYPHPVQGKIEVHETHISVVFLSGDFAYKIKKPMKTDFLDYSTLELRKQYCEDEIRLDCRYAIDLYLTVVPIGWNNGRLCVDAPGEPIEYAVKMRRFPKGALLSDRVEAGKLTTAEVHQLAESVASFHKSASVCAPKFASGWTDYLVKNLQQVVSGLQPRVGRETAASVKVLQDWSNTYFSQHRPVFESRSEEGFIRECHGDLHLQNVVHWGNRLVPFDGIEFNDRLRWIDVICDAAFLEMDLAFCGHVELARSFINAYLEQTGDYRSLVILRWFLVYRSLIRAMVATMRSEQSHLTSSERDAAILDARKHVSLAYRFTLKETPRLWITHGVSGSGKTTLSETVVQRHDAFRLRSDIERKRLFGLSPTQRPSAQLQAKMYSEESNEKSYAHLRELASGILRAGYSVIIDATFLKRSDRARFHALAQEQGVSFAILDCHSDEQTLRQRVADRMTKNSDASDADVQVLERQLAAHEPLTETERSHVIDIPDLVQVVDHL